MNKKNKVEVLLPLDSVNALEVSNESKVYQSMMDSVSDDYMGLDIGKKTISHFKLAILGSNTVLWNGPMGVFELSNFEKGTYEIGKAVAQVTTEGAFTLVGGGDSVAAAKKFGIDDQVSFLSTGGGAMLAYFEGKTLPAFEALQ